MKKSRPPFLNACHMISAAFRALCAFPTALFPEAIQELVLLWSPFYKQENSASEKLGTCAGVAWLIKSTAWTQTRVYGTSHPSLCAWTLYFTVLKTTTAVKYEATMFLYATTLAQHISHSAFCHIKPTDLVLIPLEYYTIRWWARRKKKKSKLDGQGNKTLLLSPPQALPSKAQCTLLYFSSNPWRYHLLQIVSKIVHSSPHQALTVMETFLYLEHKYWEPKGVSSERSVMHNWHFI